MLERTWTRRTTSRRPAESCLSEERVIDVHITLQVGPDGQLGASWTYRLEDGGNASLASDSEVHAKLSQAADTIASAYRMWEVREAYLAIVHLIIGVQSAYRLHLRRMYRT